MVELVESHGGVVVPVRVQPRASRAGVLGEHQGALRVAVCDPPEKGKANQAVLEVLAKAFHLRKSQLEILSGTMGRQKRILITDCKITSLQRTVGKLCK